MEQISAEALHALLQTGTPLQLIDVREPYEYEAFNIGGLLLPLAEVVARRAEVALDRMVVVVCRKGVRSQIAIQKLQQKLPAARLVNLSGGLEAWKQSVGS